MTTKLEQAARQALGALVRAEAMYGQPNADIQTALREALSEQAEQEPVHEALQIASVALQDIACSSQTENLYWWQLRARKAQKQIAECLTNAAPVEPAKQEPVATDMERTDAYLKGYTDGKRDSKDKNK